MGKDLAEKQRAALARMPAKRLAEMMLLGLALGELERERAQKRQLSKLALKPESSGAADEPPQD